MKETQPEKARRRESEPKGTRTERARGRESERSCRGSAEWEDSRPDRRGRPVCAECSGRDYSSSNISPVLSSFFEAILSILVASRD